MSLGICTIYQNHEATHVAMRLALWAMQRGIEVSIFPTTKQHVPIDKQWDGLAKASRGRKFTDWAATHTTIIWTHVPAPEQITYAKRMHISTILFGLWHDVMPDDCEIIKLFDVVLAPCTRSHRFYTTCGGKRVHTLPWDTGLPFTLKDCRLKLDQRWLLLPLFDQEPCKTEVTTVDIVGRVLERHDNTILTVMYNSSTMGSRAKRKLKQCQKRFGDRVRLLSKVPVPRRPLIFRCHDLTIWPTQRENTGMIGLTSLTMGTPVVAFTSSTIEEIVTNNNGYLVQCPQLLKPVGVPYPDADYVGMEAGLDVLLDNPSHLRSLQQSVLIGLADRRSHFNAVMGNVYKE